MADVINLKRVRKAIKRKEKDETAAANRCLYGEPGHVKKQRELTARLETQRLDGHEVERED